MTQNGVGGGEVEVEIGKGMLQQKFLAGQILALPSGPCDVAFRRTFKVFCRECTEVINDTLNSRLEFKQRLLSIWVRWHSLFFARKQSRTHFGGIAAHLDLADKIKLIGNGSQSLYFIDKEIESINKTQQAAGNKGNKE